MKSQENQSISQYFWLKKGFWFGFLFALSLELGCYLYIEKKNKQKRKNSFLVIFLQNQFKAAWKTPILKICVIFAFLLTALFWKPVRMWMCRRMPPLKSWKRSNLQQIEEHNRRKCHTSDLHLGK